MREWPYAKEPFDFKLFVLLFFKKLWIVLVGMLAGVVVIGGGYYLKKVVFGGPEEYEITTTYYVEYNTYNEETGELASYVNSATWGSLVAMDWFVDRAWEHALEAGMKPEVYGVKKSDLKSFFTATLPSDLRIPTSTVTTPSEELTTILNAALQQTFADFAIEQREMEEIRVIDETSLTVADKDVRIFRACVLGAVVGLFITGFGVAFVLIWDDSVYLPETFTYRYGIPMLGFMGKEEKLPGEETLLNLNYLFSEGKKNVLIILGEKVDSAAVSGRMPQGSFENTLSAAALKEKDYESLRQSDGILLAVGSGEHNGREIEHVLHQLQVQECSVKAALLCNSDTKLITSYYFGRKQGK